MASKFGGVAVDQPVAQSKFGGTPIAEPEAIPLPQEQAQQPLNVASLLSQFEQAKQANDFQTADRIMQQLSGLQSEAIGGAVTAIPTIASAAIAEPVAGIAGILAGGGDEGVQAIESTREALTIDPMTPQAGEFLQEAGELAEFIPDVAGGAGELAFEATGSPAIAAGVEGVVTVLPELFGLGALRKMKVGTKLLDNTGRPTKELRRALDKQGLVYENLTPKAKASIPAIADQSFVTGRSLVPQNAERALAEQIKSGGRDDALAGLKISGDDVVPDAKGVEALKQGYAPGFVQSVKTMTPETKSQAKKMLNISRRIKNQERVSLDIRPGDIVGDAVTKRVKFIRDQANAAKKNLDSIVKTKLGGKTIDPEKVRVPLTESLDRLDIRLIDSNGGRPIVDFSESIISKNRPAQKAINDAVDLLFDAQKTGDVSALKAHKLKRQLDDIIDFKKKSAQGLSESGRNVLKSVRAGLNDSIREVDADYARVNDVLSKSITALDDFDKATGASIDIFGPGADSAIGTKMRGLMSNIQSRVNLENSVNQLDEVARGLASSKGKELAIFDGKTRKAGAPVTFNDDVKDLAMFANALDARFGAVAKSSFQGNIEQAINRVLNQGLAQEVIQQGAGKVASTANKLRGVNEFNAFEAMQDLLNE